MCYFACMYVQWDKQRGLLCQYISQYSRRVKWRGWYVIGSDSAISVGTSNGDMISQCTKQRHTHTPHPGPYHTRIVHSTHNYRRKFRSQTSDNMDRWKAEQGRGREKRKIRREKIRRERVRRKKMQMREKVGKSRNTVFFQWFVAPEGRKVGSLKRRVRSQLARWEMKICTPLWREAHFEVKMYKTHHSRTTFGSWDVEKVHAVVARSTFWSQNVQNTPCSDHFWKLRYWKSARRCGAKHISKSKCTKHHMFAPLLEVRMSFRVAGARDCGPCQKWAKREGFVAFSTTTTTTPHYTPIHYTTLQLQLHLDYILLHYTPLHYTALNYIQIISNTLNYTTLHYITLHYTPLHYSTLHYTTLHYTTLPSTTLHYTTLHSTTTTTTQNYTTLHYITLHYTTFHYTPLHYTTLHWMTLHHR